MNKNNILTQYAVYPTHLKSILSETFSNKKRVFYVIKSLLESGEDKMSGLTLALIKKQGTHGFIHALAKEMNIEIKTVWKAYDIYVKRHGTKPILLTGAEAVALILKEEKVKTVYAYPGTSELILCDAILKTPGLRLINGRGDKESAFMAAGGCLLSPNTAVAILHGARGLTNAAGAIADAYRNEIGTVFIVGLPSTTSSPFLPPHGEVDLIKNIGGFVKIADEITLVAKTCDSSEEKNRKASIFIKKVKKIFCETKSLPSGPGLIGIPQDALEKRFIPLEMLNSIKPSLPSLRPSEADIDKATKLIQEKKHPVILIDDYLFKNPEAKKQLKLFAQVVRAPILQVFYRRGPMLFEKLTFSQNPYFVGPYTIENLEHQKLMENADLLITLEDRNTYPRVVGKLPNCQKIALTSNPKKTRKNAYLGKGDILMAGDVTETMVRVIEKLPKITANTYISRRLRGCCREIRQKSARKTVVDAKYNFMRKELTEELARAFKRVKQPVLVDDSQIFGGLLAESYDRFPSFLRVFGDHSAFIGAGISYAAGLAHNYPKATVFCCLGDQSFTNGLQGLVCVVQEKIKVIYLVCNNGKSVSLTKQVLSQDNYAFNKGKNKFLDNVYNMSYWHIAKEIGLKTYYLKFDPDSPRSYRANLKKILRKILWEAIKCTGPVLIELEVPASLDAWQGIWAVKGNEDFR